MPLKIILVKAPQFASCTALAQNLANLDVLKKAHHALALVHTRPVNYEAAFSPMETRLSGVSGRTFGCPKGGHCSSLCTSQVNLTCSGLDHRDRQSGSNMRALAMCCASDLVLAVSFL